MGFRTRASGKMGKEKDKANKFGPMVHIMLANGSAIRQMAVVFCIIPMATSMRENG